jgi:hypothetical protein
MRVSLGNCSRACNQPLDNQGNGKRTSDLRLQTSDLRPCLQRFAFLVLKCRGPTSAARGPVQTITIVTMLAQVRPGLNSARMVCCMGNWLRWSPQNPIVDDVPLCRSVTNVICTVVPFSPMIALSCTTLTDPLMLEVAPGRAPRTNTFPHPTLVTTRQTCRRVDSRSFMGHHPCKPISENE